jgi:glutamate synthase domain-containing protein 1
LVARPSRIIDACGIFGTISRCKKLIPGSEVASAMEAMKWRYNGLGAGFAGYGIYPEYDDAYAIHAGFYAMDSKKKVEELLRSRGEVVYDEPIPTQELGKTCSKPILWRYFFRILPTESSSGIEKAADDLVVDLVSKINEEGGAFVMSSGKNMGVFKALGYPWDVSKLYKIEDYEAYMWLGHGRYPTNTPGWWGGCHPFNILGWSVVHNGEISSYGRNKRYVEQWGYRCNLLTDSEVLAYLFDLLVRRHELPIKVACKVLSPPFWKDVDDAYNDGDEELLRAVRFTYSDALVDGPFSIIVATTHGIKALIGLTDRLKLRPLVAAEDGDRVYIASEECAIRVVCPEPEFVWFPKAGEPVLAEVQE